jgi:hypothetical protein
MGACDGSLVLDNITFSFDNHQQQQPEELSRDAEAKHKLEIPSRYLGDGCYDEACREH